jgi:hypothetical protein
MNRLIKAINLLNSHLNENNGSNKENPSIILSEKNNKLHALFGYNDLNNCILCCGKCEKENKNNIYSCKLCNNNRHYLINLRKIAYLKKNNDNRLCINLRKQFDKISSLENLYNSELENISNFKEYLKSNPCIYYEAKEKLVNYNKKKKKLQKQILFEEQKLINKRYTYIILFRKIDV